RALAGGNRIVAERKGLAGRTDRLDPPPDVTGGLVVPGRHDLLGPGSPAGSDGLLLAEQPRDEGAQGEPVRVRALAEVVDVRYLAKVLQPGGRVFADCTERREHVVRAAVLSEEDLEPRLGFVPLPRARRGDPLAQRLAPRVGDRIHGAPTPAGPFLARVGQ